VTRRAFVWCATSPTLDGMGGVYCENCDIAPVLSEEDAAKRRMGGANRWVGTIGVMPYAVDPDAARRLWTLSERLVGLAADVPM
jgi:hypothetical protein